MSDPNKKQLFNLDFEVRGSVKRQLFKVAKKPLENLLSLHKLNQLYDKVANHESDQAFYDRLLDQMNVNYRISEEDMKRIPEEGKLVVVANHPFGGIEGVIMASLLRSVRPDSKIMANYILERIPDLREVFFFVDPFGGKDAARANIASLKQSLQWLHDGHVLGIFPAGEVAHFSISKRKIIEPEWNESVAAIIRKTESPVLPVYFNGFNGPLFHMLGMIHPRLRTAMLPKELYNKHDRDIDICIGNPVDFKKLKTFANNKELIDYLRERTFMLQNRAGERKGSETSISVQLSERKMTPVIDPLPQETLVAEIEGLPEPNMLIETNDYRVYFAKKNQIPAILREIGRLREVTFRGTHEGTGKEIDLDEFDDYYDHLFVWNREKNELVGAYRIGRTDDIIRRFGKKGLYTSTLFKMKSSLFNEINPALEMGRSFVRPEYQRSFAPLLLLWKGIGQFVNKHPQYRVLFGPVSISSEYHSLSRHLMVTFLKLNNYLPDMAKKVRPKRPYRGRSVKGIDPKNRNMIGTLEDVSELVSEFESDNKGVPILLKQYLKLGGKILGFNVDPDFSDVLDGLILVDLTKTDRKILRRYMGDEGLASFLQFHGLEEKKDPVS